jgi:heat shock protein HtpX
MMSKFYNNMKTALLLGLLTSLILVIGAMLGGRTGVMIALIFAAGMNFVAFFFSDKIAIASMGAQEVGPDHELYRITEQLVQRANMPMPRVYVSPQPAPNAFATGRSPRHAAVCATQGLLDMLDRNEVAGVMAHELAHVKNRDVLISTVAATIAGAISSLGYMFMFTGGSSSDDEDGGSHPLAGLAVMILGPIAAGLIQMAISRSREFVADKQGAEICGDPMHLATALEKIHAAAHQIPMNVNPAYNSMFIAEPMNFARSVGNLFQTHPPLEARLTNLIGRPTTGRFSYAA